MEQRAELKRKARELERTGQMEAALEVHRRIASEVSDGGSGPLWARIGDLQERLGQRDSAADSYSRAVAAFAEAGQTNNAIALCCALLRLDPESPGAQLRLGELSLAEGYREFARDGIGAFARQVAATDDAEAAVEPVAAFLRRFPDEDDLWRDWLEELVGLGKENEALAILRRLGGMAAEQGSPDTAARLNDAVRKIRPEAAEPASFSAPRVEDSPAGVETAAPDATELPLLGYDSATSPTPEPDISRLEGFEPTRAVDTDEPDDAYPEAEPLPFLDTTATRADDLALAGEPDDLTPTGESDGEPDPFPLLGFGLDEDDDADSPGEDAGALPLLDPMELERDSGSDADDVATFDAVVDELLAVSAAEVEHADPGTHYDLGLAFKEMGRFDEALGNLALAIRGGYDPVATLEVVGEILVDSGRHDLVTRLLSGIPGAGERPAAELLGVHYWLARAAEAEGRDGEARRALDLVVAVDPDFRDASARAATLSEARFDNH